MEIENRKGWNIIEKNTLTLLLYFKSPKCQMPNAIMPNAIMPIA